MTADEIDRVLAAVPMPLLTIGRDGRISAINAPAEVLFGRGARGRHHAIVVRHPSMLDCIEIALATGTAQGADHRAGDAAWRVTASPFDGGLLLAFTETGAELAAGEMRRDFVANVSHELRSPVTAMLGFIETLRGPARDDPAARDRFLEIMQAEAQRMARLVSDLLSLSRVEANERLRPTTRVELKGLVDHAVTRLSPQAALAGKSLAVEGVAAQLTVPGDSDQLLQVLTNLIENALAYGGPAVTVGLITVGYDPGLRGPAARLTVADDGPGIDPLHLPRLTERFWRADTHRSRAAGGTGLGLAIVKHIVNRHRGRLRIDSLPGQGTRVAVSLPSTKIGLG